MNGSLRVALVFTAFAVIVGSAFGEGRKDIASGQSLSIHLYDEAHAPARVLQSAIGEASRLFGTTRMQIGWECPSTEVAEDRGTDMTSARFQQPDTRGYIVVRLLKRTANSIFPGALGYALPFAHSGAHVLIFYDRVEALTRGLNQATYIILGHAIAHEIGHVLLGSSEHTIEGLMQARWTPATWRLASAGLLAFSREESARMVAGVVKLEARQHSAVQPGSGDVPGHK
jgi:hypothetical protein